MDLNVPGWQWSGHGYLDGNFGTRSLEDDFSYWTWSRLIGKDGAMAFYDAKRREGGDLDLGLEFIIIFCISLMILGFTISTLTKLVFPQPLILLTVFFNEI